MSVDILLVEDNAADARLVREACAEGGLDVSLTVAEDGIQAMDMLRARIATPPDIVLLDLNLPGRDGREVLAEIKGDPLLKDIPVVVLTTSSSPADVCQAYNLHANCYVTKPADFEEFVQVMQSIADFWFDISTSGG